MGSFVGLRGEESRARAMYRRTWGPIHKSAKDGTWQVCPLLDWTGMDVFAYTIANEIPLHPFYQRVWERFHASEDPSRIRVDMAIMPEAIAAKGAMATIAWAYPAFWRRLVLARPELKRYV